MSHIPWDRVICRLSARRDVISDTVRVSVTATVSLSGAEATKLKEMLASALQKVLPGAWELNSVSRSEESSGLEQIRALGSIRVAEHATAGLVERLRQASRAGLKLELTDIHYRPPRKELEQAKAELRREIYRLAQEEASVLTELLPPGEMPWRVAAVDVTESVQQRRRGRRPEDEQMSMMNSMSPHRARESGDQPSRDVIAGVRVEAVAQVVLRRLGVPLPPEAFIRTRR